MLSRPWDFARVVFLASLAVETCDGMNGRLLDEHSSYATARRHQEGVDEMTCEIFEGERRTLSPPRGSTTWLSKLFRKRRRELDRRALLETDLQRPFRWQVQRIIRDIGSKFIRPRAPAAENRG